jgi:hypothetical protein
VGAYLFSGGNMAELTPALIAMVVGAIVSLAASYVPGFRTRWAALKDDTKQTAMAGAMVIVGVVVYVAACTPAIGLPFVACPAGGVWSLFAIILSALMGNQSTDRVSPDMPDVKAVKAAKP